MEVPINRNDIYTLYSNAQSDEEKINIVAKYIFDLSKLNTENESDLIDEEIDDLYFDRVSKLRKEIIEENSNRNAYKLYKNYQLPKKEDYKPTEQDFYWEDYLLL